VRLFIIGAGATIGTLGTPGVKGFGSHLEHQLKTWRSELGKLSTVVDALAAEHRRTPADWDLDAAWTHIDYFAKLYPALGEKASYEGSAAAGIHAAVTAVYGTLDVARVLRAYDAGNKFTLREEIDRVARGDVVASFNWDILIESLLCHRLARTSIGVVQAPRRATGDEVQFAKPHGSLTWNRHDLPGILIDDGKGGPRLSPVPSWKDVVDSERSPTNRKVEPLVLGAVPMKSELIQDVSKPQYRAIIDQWEALCRGLQHATAVCVIGYGFPPEDTHGRYLMRRAVLRRLNRFERVDLYAHPSTFHATRAAIVEVLGVSPNDIADRGTVNSVL
jgi:hypothetical protein